MPAEKPSTAKELRTCLDTVGRALASGDLGALAPLSAQLDELGQRLARNPRASSREDLLLLKEQAARQMRLLGAARDGVKAAIRRVDLIRRASGEFATYDRAGHGRTLRFEPSNLEQRA